MKKKGGSTVTILGIKINKKDVFLVEAYLESQKGEHIVRKNKIFCLFETEKAGEEFIFWLRYRKINFTLLSSEETNNALNINILI